MNYMGDFLAGETVVIPFNTFNSSGASVTVTDLVAGDVHIHKDGGTTQRSSSAGVTVSIDFDGITGCHIVSIDTSDNTDAGFYSTATEFQVRLEGITVDSQTLNPWIGTFSIQNRYMRGTDGALTDKTGFSLSADQSAVTIGTCTTNTDMRGTDGALTDKDGFTLSAAGIDSIIDEVLTDLSNTDIDAGQTITVRKAMRALFNRFYRKVTQTATTQTVFNDSNSAIADMTVSDDGTTQTKGST